MPVSSSLFLLFFFNDTATTEIYTLSLHDALPISRIFAAKARAWAWFPELCVTTPRRSEEHTSELQSPDHLVCRLLLEKKKKTDPLRRNNSSCQSLERQPSEPI